MIAYPLFCKLESNVRRESGSAKPTSGAMIDDQPLDLTDDHIRPFWVIKTKNSEGIEFR